MLNMRDFKWDEPLWAVIKDNGDYAGSPCLSLGEAQELANQREGAQIFRLYLSSWGSQVWPPEN
jgi:hypothetical protein